MARGKHKLLIVEDEQAIQQGLIDVFVFHGYEVKACADGAKALELCKANRYDLIILDVMLPTLDGFSVCEQIKKHNPNQPVIMLTAKTSEEDIIMGLSLGADDYVGKPFSIRELVLRVEAVLRRTYVGPGQKEELIIGSLQIDCNNLVGTKANSSERIMFTRKEVDILEFLDNHSKRPVSREELLEIVWGYKKAASIETRTVDIHIAKLRRKLERDPKNPEYLVTIRGEGYRLVSNNV